MIEMRAMQCDGPSLPLRLVRRALPVPAAHEVLLEIAACGVCRTDLHVVDGEIPAQYPIVPGHEIVGRVIAIGDAVTTVAPSDRVGVPWLGRSCGMCAYCRGGAENLCDNPSFTGCTRDGGFATHVVADARFCFAIPARFSDREAAPLLCAGLIGWRALGMVGDATRIGLYGFGAAAHILAQVCIAQGRAVYAFTSAGDATAQHLARDLGCVWAGGSDESPREMLDAAILFAPVGALVPRALKTLRKGGRVVCAGIHMSDIPTFPYHDLWGERSIRSVANLTRRDGIDFFLAISAIPLRIVTQPFALAHANEALAALRAGKVSGAAIILPGA